MDEDDERRGRERLSLGKIDGKSMAWLTCRGLWKTTLIGRDNEETCTCYGKGRACKCIFNTDDDGGCTMVAELYHTTSYHFEISNLDSSISTPLFPSLRQPYCNF